MWVDKYSKPYMSDFIDSFKGKVDVLNPEQSELAKNLNLKKKGLFAIRLR